VPNMLEIERKFLVFSTDWGTARTIRPIEQGYLFISKERNMRIRRSADSYSLTLKVAATKLARHEVELPVESAKGRAMLDSLCVTPVIRKLRHVVEWAGKDWEIDVFEDDNAGLIVAEIELDDEDETFDLPRWVGPEVTGDTRFFNAALSTHPFKSWGVSYAELVADKSAQAIKQILST